MNKIFFLLFLLFAVNAQAAVSFDASATTDTTATAAPSVNLTVGGGCTDRIIVAMVAWWEGGGAPGSVSSMTIGGSAATFIAGISPGSAAISRRMELWYRVGVSTGSNTITATMSTSMAVITISVRSYCGAHQTTTLGTSATADNIGNDNFATVNVSSAGDELVIDAVMTASVATTLTPGAGQTQHPGSTDVTNVGYFLTASSDKTGSGTTTMSWTADLNDYTGIIAVPLKPVAVVGPTPVRRMVVMMQ